MMREFGAVEVHMRIGSTPIISPCYFGVDLPTREELIANSRTIEEVRKMIHATSLEYISVDELVNSIGIPREELCMACSYGDYPLNIATESCIACRKVTPTKKN
jgi:amidophosphoribosyltransferase